MAPAWKLGFSTAWDAERDFYSLRAMIPHYRDARIDCVETAILWEWEAEHYTLHDEALKRLIGTWQDGGIEVWSVHLPAGRAIDISNPTYAQAGIDLVGGYMEACARMGIDKVVLHPSFGPIAPEERALRLQTSLDSVRKLYRSDLHIAVETMPRTDLCNTVAETMAYLEALQGIAGCCVDVNHCQKDKPQDVITAVGDRLLTVHIADDDGIDERHWFPGKGVLDWRAILQALRTVGYEGCFMYELWWRHYDDPANIRRNYDMLLEKYGS